MIESLSKFKVGLVQMTSGTSVSDNVRDAEALIREAAAAGAVFILTPEMTTLLEFNSGKAKHKIQTEDEDTSWPYFAALAAELDIWLMIGSIAIRIGEKAANRCYLFSPEGKKVVSYDKIHMFDVDIPGDKKYQESNSYRAGNTAVVVPTPYGKIGLSICYDVRFPYLYRALAHAGAEILTVPAAFTYVTGKAHWHTLLRARAIENGAYVFAPAQVGDHADGRKTFGHSLVVDPWGNIVADGKNKPGVIMADIDMSLVAKARNQIASLTHDKNIAIQSLK
jgi:predicted amidohydrolase